jgi:hypothetical protein
VRFLEAVVLVLVLVLVYYHVLGYYRSVEERRRICR